MTRITRGFTSEEALEAANGLGVAGDPTTTAKIALAHLRESADYYSRLALIEE